MMTSAIRLTERCDTYILTFESGVLGEVPQYLISFGHTPIGLVLARRKAEDYQKYYSKQRKETVVIQDQTKNS